MQFRKHYAFFVIISLLLILSFSYPLFYLYTPSVTAAEGVIYEVKLGSSTHHVLNDLAKQNIITSPSIYMLYAYAHPFAELKAGEYLFPQGATPASIWEQMTTGKGLQQYAFTIIPGWTFKQLRIALQAEPQLTQKIVSLSDQEVMAKLGQAQLSPEGEFFPETYYYIKGATDLSILKRAFQLMQNKIYKAWQARNGQLPFHSPYEALVAASLVEKEAYLHEERPIIAGVLINRLKQNMPLQFDPTVIYAMGDQYQGVIHQADLKINSPYNTYVNKGLPPTPIAIPGEHSISAIMHPKQHNYLYFVATGINGSHEFSETFSNHRHAIAQAQNNQIYFNDKRCYHYLKKLLRIHSINQISKDSYLHINDKRIINGGTN